MGPVDQLEDRHLRKVEATGSKEGAASHLGDKDATHLKITSGPFF